MSSHGTVTPRPAPRYPMVSGVVSSPQSVASPAFPSYSPHHPLAVAHWTRILPSVCAFLEMLVKETTLSNISFELIVASTCLCFGQDYSMPDAGWAATHHLLLVILDAQGGRRGEQVVRNILEGKLSTDARTKLAEAEREVTRGAVM